MPRIKKDWYPISTAPENEIILAIQKGVHSETGVPYYPVVGIIKDGIFTSTSTKTEYNLKEWGTHWMPIPLNPALTQI